MQSHHTLHFSSPAARLQYLVLMTLFRLAFDRHLFGIFTRSLARLFDPANAVDLRENGGPRFKIYLNDAYWTRFALYRPPYEPEVAAILNAATGLTGLFCDLGANKGYWTTRASALFDHVEAVEASGQTYRFLSENAAQLPNVTLRQAAIHAVSGQRLTFVNTHLSHASARLLDETEAGQSDSTEMVETLCIDDIVPLGTSALIKLDVEGAEIAAIDGAARALRDGAVLIYEDHGADTSCAPSAHLLKTQDMCLYSIENGLKPMRTIDEIRHLKTDTYKGYNFLAARADSPLLCGLLEHFANP